MAVDPVKLLTRGAPIVTSVLKALFEGLANNETDEEIRQRIASPETILKKDLSELREARDDLDEYVRTGG